MAMNVALPEPIYRRVEAEARRRGRSVPEFVAEALERLLRRGPEPEGDAGEPFDLPSYHMGAPRVDINCRATLDETLEESQVEAAAQPKPTPQRRFPTRTYNMGKPKVDINDREQLYRAMDGL